MRQVSAEAETIFDLIQSLGTLSGGDWGSLRLKADVNEEPFYLGGKSNFYLGPPDLTKAEIDAINAAILPYLTDARKAYLTKMLAFLQSGDIEKHKQAAIDWLSDAHPVVETWAGFLEPGRDPSGVRCEFRTLVAVKDKSWERAFTDLAAGAEQLIFQLPWNAGLRSPFELDKFVLPDLSALNLLCYCVSNQYTGLTAPGYPDIKAKYGYKNLTFTNRAKANSGVADQDYVVDEDLETAPGEFNFDPADLPLNPLTDEPVNSWYSIGQSPETAFVGIATGYVECLAEGIGLYIMSAEGALKILAPDTEMDEDEVIYNAYLSIACMGLRALRSYDSRSQKWGQVHDHARYGLLRCFVASGVAKVEVRNEDCETDLKPRRSVKVTLNRDKIATVGRQALGDLIFKLQICRSIKDVARGTAIFLDLTTVDEQGLLWKEVVEENQKPRTLFVHANTILTESGDVVLKEYPPTKEGLIQAWLDRGPL
ncbi:hypothetical protein SBRCBS47491_007505 [Sporothrix bragantina]|uniref:Uncharacterized protein n=1 Tax=Sporothrix bragantina TaxID=671064 RepID=A0ABP0CDQ9_9PEZI